MRKYCIVNFENQQIIEKLKEYGYTCIATEKSFDVSEPVSFHADMLYLKVADNKFLVSSCQKKNIELLKKYGMEVETVKLYPGYKNECKLNLIVTEYDVIANTKTSVALEKIADDRNLINVNQGYTRCSTVVIGKDSFITEDSGIYKKLISKGKNCLLLEKGYVTLKGYEYGFIGGASAYIQDKNTVLFFGDITTHPDFINIKNFLKNINVDFDFISDICLTDIGGLIII